MAWKLEKLSGDDNLIAVFCLTIPDYESPVTFTRQTFRKVFEDERGFTPQRVGYVLRLLNELYPLPRRDVGLEDRYVDSVLVDYLCSLGFRVTNPISSRIDPLIAINLLEQKGYQVHGWLGSVYYFSPELSFSRN